MSNGNPSWMEPSVSTTSSPYDKPSWLADDVKGTGTASWENDGQVQMVAVQNDGIPETPTTVATSEESRFHTARARQKTWGEFWSSSFKRDGRTILIALLVIVCMNIPYVKYALYPFTIFSTWIHEFCHAMAAVMVGGKVSQVEIFSDTSGLTTFSLPAGSNRAAFVASAGYQGTPVIGMLLLFLRRTKRGPRAGTFALAFMLLLTVALWIRNAFGIAFILCLGVLLALGAWKLSSFWMRNLYVLLAVTTALNGITSIKALFGSNQQVNGQDMQSDATVMAELKGGTHTMWALIWLFLGIVLAFFGLVFAIPGPGESADFTLCGACQDCGCFYICNLEGRRLWSNLFGKSDDKKDTSANEPAV